MRTCSFPPSIDTLFLMQVVLRVYASRVLRSLLTRLHFQEKLNNAKLAFRSRPGHGDVLALDFTDTDVSSEFRMGFLASPLHPPLNSNQFLQIPRIVCARIGPRAKVVG